MVVGEDAAAGADHAPVIQAPLVENGEEADAIGGVGMVLEEAKDEEADALPAGAPAEVAANERVGVAVGNASTLVWELLVVPQARNPWRTRQGARRPWSWLEMRKFHRANVPLIHGPLVESDEKTDALPAAAPGSASPSSCSNVPIRRNAVTVTSVHDIGFLPQRRVDEEGVSRSHVNIFNHGHGVLVSYLVIYEPVGRKSRASSFHFRIYTKNFLPVVPGVLLQRCRGRDRGSLPLRDNYLHVRNAVAPAHYLKLVFLCAIFYCGGGAPPSAMISAVLNAGPRRKIVMSVMDVCLDVWREIERFWTLQIYWCVDTKMLERAWQRWRCPALSYA